LCKTTSSATPTRAWSRWAALVKDELLDTPLETLIDYGVHQALEARADSAVWNPLNLRMFTSETHQGRGEKAQYA
jgi:hypothetical protein